MRRERFQELALFFWMVALFALPLQLALECFYWIFNGVWFDLNWPHVLSDELRGALTKTSALGFNSAAEYIILRWVTWPFTISAIIIGLLFYLRLWAESIEYEDKMRLRNRIRSEMVEKQSTITIEILRNLDDRLGELERESKEMARCLADLEHNFDALDASLETRRGDKAHGQGERVK